jgi:hypothetical protein
MVGKRGITSNGQQDAKEGTGTYLSKDVEEGRPQQDRKYRFRDQASLDPDDQRRVEFKSKLLDGVDTSDLERFRKSDEEVCPIKLGSN